MPENEPPDLTGMVVANWMIVCETDPSIRLKAREKSWSANWFLECLECNRLIEVTNKDLQRMIDYETSGEN